MSYTANFTTQQNAGVQVGQNLGSINYYQNDSRESECLQLFRLANVQGYQWYMERIPERANGTLQWLLGHPVYQSWENGVSGPLLVSADPGCGKSVLAKHLVKHRLRDTVCYFFFKDEDQNTAVLALCGLLHQLFGQLPFLIRHAMEAYDQDGPKLINQFDVLWRILESALNDIEAGQLTIVLDALDECEQLDLQLLLHKLTNLYQRETSSPKKFKFFLTSRPYEQIMSGFFELVESFPRIRIPGEDFSDDISQEVNYAIEQRVTTFSRKFRLAEGIKQLLLSRLGSIQHRTYLWLYLIFDYLEHGFQKEGLERTKTEIETYFQTIPGSVNQAYEKILAKSTNTPKAFKSLSLILAAARPLGVQELNVAVHVDPSTRIRFITDLDLETEAEFTMTLRNWCGLLITIHNGRIYLLHQTLREFLLAMAEKTNIGSHRWFGSIDIQESHLAIAKICIRYLSAIELDLGESKFVNSDLFHLCSSFVFFEYSARHWVDHHLLAKVEPTAEFARLIIALCSPGPLGLRIPRWVHLSGDERRLSLDFDYSTLMILCSLGMALPVQMHLPKDDVNYATKSGLTALLVAAVQHNPQVLEVLLDSGAFINAQSSTGNTALHYAVEKHRSGNLRLLLERGANTEIETGRREATPLWLAAAFGDEYAVEILLEHDANVLAQDRRGNSVLDTSKYSSGVMRTLLKHVTTFDIPSGLSTPTLELMIEEAEQRLMQEAAEATAEMAAAWGESYGEFEYLIECDSLLDPEAPDVYDGYQEPRLTVAASHGDWRVVQHILEEGADVNVQTYCGETALQIATLQHNGPMIQVLLNYGAKIDIPNQLGETALSLAHLDGYDEIISLLLGTKQQE